MTNELQQTRYDRLLRRVGGIIGPGSKVSEVLTELFPTLDVESVPGELLFLSGWNLGMGGGSLAAGAGNRAKFQVVNPAGSGLLVVVTRLEIASNSSQPIHLNPTATLFVTNPGTATKRDTRTGVGQTVTEVRTSIDASTTSATYVLQNLNGSPAYIEDVNGIAVLSPGFALEIGQTATAGTLDFGALWRERTAELSELAF